MAVLGLLALKAFPSLVTVATIYDGPVIDVHWVRLVGVTVWWLLAISAAAVSWQIDRYGWAGVKDVDITPVGEHAERQQATREQTYALPTGDGSWEEKYAGSVENDEVPDELLELAAADDQPETFDDQPSDDQSTPIFTLPSGDYTTSKE